MSKIKANRYENTATTDGGIDIDTSGNVGIGTSSPSHNLTIKGSTPGLAFVPAADTQTMQIAFRQSADSATRGAIRYDLNTNALAFDANNSERARIDSSGRLLLGLSSSIGGNALLQVQGSGNRKAHFHQPDTGSCITQFTNSTTGSGSTDGLLVGLDSTEDGMLWLYENQNLTFATNNSERMRINSSGNVGIGDSSPDRKLQVINSTDALMRLGRSDASSHGSTDVEIKFAKNYYSNAVFEAASHRFEIQGTEKMRIDSSGRLLVGTSTSTQIGGREGSLQVSAINSSMTLLQTQTNNTGAYFSFGTKGNGTGGAVVQDGPLGRIQFCGFDGTDYQSVGAEIRSEVNGIPGANDMPGRLMFLTTADGASSPSERMRVDNSGRLFLFNITGNAASGSTLKYNASDDEVRYDTSSRLLKTDITELPYGIETVKNLKPSRYTPQEYDREGNLVVSTETAIGFIADEMVAEVPEVVMMYQKSTLTRNENDTEVVPAAINYDRLTAVLTKALQEAIAKIETLETKVAALEAG